MNNEPTQEASWPYAIPRIAGVITICMGLLSVLVWAFYFWIPTTLLEYINAIRPNTGICFVLLGVALWIRGNEFHHYFDYTVDACCSIVFLVSFLTLFQYIFKMDYGIDAVLFHKALVTQTIPDPGRMSPFAATNFALLSFTLFFLDNKVIKTSVHQLFTIIVILNTYFQLLAHLYSIGIYAEAYALSSHYALAGIFPVGTFLLLGIGALFARPYQGITRLLVSSSSGSALARRIIPSALIFPILFGYMELLTEVNGGTAGLRISLLIMAITISFIALILINVSLINKFDISRRKAEHSLQESQLQLQAILNYTNMVISIFDIKGKCILANKQFGKVFHLNTEEAIGKHITELYPTDYAQQILTIHKKAIETRTPVSTEETFPGALETQVFLSNHFPILDKQDKPYAICSICWDITQRKKIG